MSIYKWQKIHLDLIISTWRLPQKWWMHELCFCLLLISFSLFDCWFHIYELPMRPTWAMTVTMQLWLWRLKNSVYCWQLSIMVISVRGWYWFPRGLLLNPGFVCLSWCFDLLRLAFTVDFHSNSCVNNHRILTVSIKGNLEMFCLENCVQSYFPFSF